jgi:hypothetical protein
MSISAKRLASKAAILIVCGLAAFATGAIVVHAATSAQTAKKKKRAKGQPSFYVRAQIDGPIAPGRSAPIKFSFANNQTKNIWITRLAVTLKLDKAHVAAGCSIKRDYNVVQLPKKFFPYKLPKANKPKAKKKLKLRYRAVPAKKANGRPTLIMLAPQGVNQDACKGATLTLTYTTRSQTKKPRTLKKSVATR